MKSIYKKLFGVIAGATLLVGASSAQAAQLTQSQIQAVIQLLQSFNADPATINSVGASLGGILVSSGPDPIACPVLSSNLYIGVTDRMTGGQVSQLQRFLGINPTGYFGSITRSHVAAFQQQFAVYPITGGVGPLTRAALQRVCAGGYPNPVPIPGSSSFIFNSAFNLNVGQTASESTLGQLTVQLLSINGNTAQVTLGEACAGGTQCFYYPTQTVTMQLNQLITFQSYAVNLVGVSGASATFFASHTVTQQPNGVPNVSSISPTQGAVGTVITLYGNGFTKDNTIHFGSGGAVHVASYNGTTLTFTIPSYAGPCDYVGDTSPVRCMAAVQQVQPGLYNVSVSNANGQSAVQTFTVTGPSIGYGPISLTQPIVGQMFTRGQTMPIAWSANSSIPSTVSVVLDLYSQGGAKVGTIAIPEARMGSYSWGIPRFPQNYMCTLQFPNGLCGTSIPTGQYYLVATVSTDPFNMSNTAAVLGTSQSGIFTINQQ